MYSSELNGVSGKPSRILFNFVIPFSICAHPSSRLKILYSVMFCTQLISWTVQKKKPKATSKCIGHKQQFNLVTQQIPYENNRKPPLCCCAKRGRRRNIWWFKDLESLLKRIDDQDVVIHILPVTLWEKMSLIRTTCSFFLNRFSEMFISPIIISGIESIVS